MQRPGAEQEKNGSCRLPGGARPGPFTAHQESRRPSRPATPDQTPSEPRAQSPLFTGSWSRDSPGVCPQPRPSAPEPLSPPVPQPRSPSAPQSRSCGTLSLGAPEPHQPRSPSAPPPAPAPAARRSGTIVPARVGNLHALARHSGAPGSSRPAPPPAELPERPRRTLCSGGTVKKPSLRIHFRRICSASGSGSPMPSAAPPTALVRRRGRILRRRRVTDFRGVSPGDGSRGARRRPRRTSVLAVRSRPRGSRLVSVFGAGAGGGCGAEERPPEEEAGGRGAGGSGATQGRGAERVRKRREGRPGLRAAGWCGWSGCGARSGAGWRTR